MCQTDVTIFSGKHQRFRKNSFLTYGGRRKNVANNNLHAVFIKKNIVTLMFVQN